MDSSAPSLVMDDELERFIRERKERVAQDKACLEQDPPYMEVRVCVCLRTVTYCCSSTFGSYLLIVEVNTSALG